MKKYVYFFSAKVYSGKIEKFSRHHGTYTTDVKITTIKRYEIFFEWLKTAIDVGFRWTDNDLVVESLTFLHEVDE